MIALGAIAFYWVLHETEQFRNLWAGLVGVLSPFVLGAAIAFIMNVPMRALERQLMFIRKDGLRRTSSIILTFVLIILVIAGVIWLLVPQITETIQSLIPKLTDFFQRMERLVLAFLEENPELLQWVSSTTGLQSLDWSGLIQKAVTMLKNSVSLIATGAFSAVGGVTSAIVDIVIGLVFSLYCLARKEILARQGRRILYAFLPERFCDESIRVMRLTNSTFSNFISGQCLEACILGCLFAVSMLVFRMPYIPLVSVLIAITALVPIVGAFVGCILGAFFILVDNPLQAVWFVIMFLVLQQFENNVIYPKVVGKSVGLPGMWVLLAVSVGGELMGVAGMLLMIPLASVLYTLLREITAARLERRGIDRNKLQDHPPEVRNRLVETHKKAKEKRQFRKRSEEAKQIRQQSETEE